MEKPPWIPDSSPTIRSSVTGSGSSNSSWRPESRVERWLDRLATGYWDWWDSRPETKLSPRQQAKKDAADKRWNDIGEALMKSDPIFRAAANFEIMEKPDPLPDGWDEARIQASVYCVLARRNALGYGDAQPLPEPYPLWFAPESTSRSKPELAPVPKHDSTPRSTRPFPKEYLDACWLLGLAGDCTPDQLDKRYASMIRSARTDATSSNALAARLDDARNTITAFQGWTK